MSEPCGTHSISGIPKEDVDQVMSDFDAQNPQELSKRKDSDGTWTVTAVFPPC